MRSFPVIFKGKNIFLGPNHAKKLSILNMQTFGRLKHIYKSAFLMQIAAITESERAVFPCLFSFICKNTKDGKAHMMDRGRSRNSYWVALYTASTVWRLIQFLLVYLFSTSSSNPEFIRFQHTHTHTRTNHNMHLWGNNYKVSSDIFIELVE